MHWNLWYGPDTSSHQTVNYTVIFKPQTNVVTFFSCSNNVIIVRSYKRTTDDRPVCISSVLVCFLAFCACFLFCFVFCFVFWGFMRFWEFFFKSIYLVVSFASSSSDGSAPDAETRTEVIWAYPCNCVNVRDVVSRDLRKEKSETRWKERNKLAV